MSIALTPKPPEFPSDEKEISTLTAERISDSEVQADRPSLPSSRKILRTAFSAYSAPIPSMSAREIIRGASTRVAKTDAGPAEAEPGSAISPSLGAMP